MTSCVGDPPTCCQPGLVDRAALAARLERLDRVHAAFRAETPQRCPWLGHRDVLPVFTTNRRTWECLLCKREFTTGA